MNKHIEINLKKYIASENPEYALMLSGKWGCGKTYFVDTFIKKQDESKLKFIKISLFGLRQLTEINQKIIFKLFIKEESSFLAGLSTIASKIIDSFGKKLNLSIGDIPIEQIMKKEDIQNVFIFDDLERTEIKISELLGYFNYLIEQVGCKVIVLANEEEIKDKEKYNDFKEKVIGKTYEIQQDFKNVFDIFLELSKNSKDILSKNYGNILEIHKKSTYNNLRHIRQAIIDFDHLYDFLDDNYKINCGFIDNFLYVYFSLFIEIRKGYLTEEDLVSHEYIALRIFQNEGEEKNKTVCENIVSKYKLLNYDMPMFSTDMWANLLFKNNISKKSINEMASNTSYFLKYESWCVLYSHWLFEEQDFKAALKDVTDKFFANKYLDKHELLLIASLLLYLSNNDLCALTINEIVIQAKKNIDSNSKTPLWEKEQYENKYKNSEGYMYRGMIYSYYEKESNDFKDIESYLRQQSFRAFGKGLRYKAEQLLLDFKSNSYKNIDNKLNIEFKNIDIFSYADKKDFVRIIQEIPHQYLNSIASCFDRYESHRIIHYEQNLVKELDFWEYVYCNLIDNIDKKENPLKHFLLRKLKMNNVKKVVDNILNAKKAIRNQKVKLMLQEITFFKCNTKIHFPYLL
ncbi:P-loop NTPase fold protein [Aliarcobacter skirrowii]|uniref:P-loop NTPase fold protein n=1 Tax=Aliarcobacter skirrowii TaxID=28200 RepID=UPI0029B3E63A|nr:P-loop NTPase fold protein [Aliarcobacter skirrowii]MDX4047694.1 P-loop NTPase fold protein [Aliarcobacter skirrowii]